MVNDYDDNMPEADLLAMDVLECDLFPYTDSWYSRILTREEGKKSGLFALIEYPK